MKKAARLIGILTLTVILTLTSCDRAEIGNTDTTPGETMGSSTDATTGEVSEKDAAKQKLREVITLSFDNVTAIEDGVLHNTRAASGDWIISRSGSVAMRKKDVNSNDEPVVICNREGCDHFDITCPAVTYNANDPIVVTSEISGETDIYYVCRDIEGYMVDGFAGFELGIYETYAIFELDLETCTRRMLYSTDSELGGLRLLGYRDGMLYFTVTDAEAVNDKRVRTTYILDVRTGELTEAAESADYLIGCQGDSLWFIRDEVLKHGPLDLSRGEAAAYLNPDSYSGTHGELMSDFYSDAAVTDDAVYFLMCSGNKDNDMGGGGMLPVYDLYKLEGDGEKFIASDVKSVRAVGGDAYFTKSDFHAYGYYGSIPMTSETGGTLYRYNGESGEVETVFEDCGGDPAMLSYAGENNIVFYGCYYEGLNSGFSEPTDSGSAYFKYDLESGEFAVLYYF